MGRGNKLLAVARLTALLVIPILACVPSSLRAQPRKLKPSDLLAVFPVMPETDLPAYLKDGGNYSPAKELTQRPDVPKGRIEAGRLERSSVFSGMPHDYSVYIPAQYRANSPACLIVVLDGSGFLQGPVPLPTLLDNLIADGDIPVMIGLFTNAGETGPGYPIYGGHTNRAVEYDSVSQDLSRFIVDELMPRLAKDYNLSSPCRLPRYHGGKLWRFGGIRSGLEQAGCLWKGHQHRRQLYEYQRRRRLSFDGASVGAKTDQNISSRWVERLGHHLWRLAPGKQADGRSLCLSRVRLSI